MDQQFKTYEKFFRKLLSSFNAGILPNVKGQIRTGLIFLCSFLILVPPISNTKMLLGILSFISTDFEAFLGLGYLYLFVIYLPISGILMIRCKPLGWILLGSWLVKRVITAILNLYQSKFWVNESDELVFPFEGLWELNVEQTTIVLIISGLVLFYLYKEEIKDVYGVNGFKRYLPVILGIAWVLLNVFIGAI